MRAIAASSFFMGFPQWLKWGGIGLCGLTFDISGRRRAQPFDYPLDGRVRRLQCDDSMHDPTNAKCGKEDSVASCQGLTTSLIVVRRGESETREAN